MTDEYYSRDVSGKEIAIYHSTSLYQWNVWGTDNVGKITANGDKFFYLKDHLGTIRVVLDESNQIVSATDYDPWGYPIDGRSYQSDNTDYKFTGKQRDTETGWDYFGARYYDARIARWGGVEPLLGKFISFSPYNYSLLNPINYFDKDGKDIYINGEDNYKVFKELQKKLPGLQLDFNRTTGKITLIGRDDLLDYTTQMFYNALMSPDIIINLNTTNENTYYDYYRGWTNITVGAFKGFEYINGKIVTDQAFNLRHAKVYEEVGGSDVGYSALHEILESYAGTWISPSEYNLFYSNIGLWYELSHAETLKMLPDNPGQNVETEYHKDPVTGEIKSCWLSGPKGSKLLYNVDKK